MKDKKQKKKNYCIETLTTTFKSGLLKKCRRIWGRKEDQRKRPIIPPKYLEEEHLVSNDLGNSTQEDNILKESRSLTCIQ